MTPEQKAKELIDMFDEFASDSGIQVGDAKYCAKECASIAVNEIVNALKSINHDNRLEVSMQIIYWCEVRDEINKPQL